jgi:hypothetical protein
MSMKNVTFVASFTLLAAAAFAQAPAYVQPMAPNGGVLRASQLWIDPTGQNDLDSDAIAWEDFQLPQTATITRVRWWGEAPPALGFMISFFNQDPGTIAVQPDIFAPGSGPIATDIYTNFTQTSAGGSLYQFEVMLTTPVTCNANTRYFVSVVGQQPLAFVNWNWAASSSGPNGTFWWLRGAHMYFHLPESRAVALATSAGWPIGNTFCFGDGSTTACPCSNPSSGTGRGCNNSAATGGASLVAAGNASLASDALVLLSADQRPTGTSVVLQGTSSNVSALVFGQGLRCVAGSLTRLYTKSAVGGGVTAPQAGDPSVSARSATQGDAIGAGQHRFYMVYYRDPVVLGGCPAASTFNGTNAVDVTWNL